MAEELRELTVRLSLSADGFAKNIKSINQQVKQAEAQFREMGAGSDKFGSSVQGLTAKLDTLRQKLDLQKAAVNQNEQALEKANAKLTQAREKHEKLSKALEEEKQKQEKLKGAVEQARAAHESAIRTYGENSDEANRLGLELVDLEKQEEESGKTVKDLGEKLKVQQKAMQNASDAASRIETDLAGARAEVKNLEAQLSRVNPHLDAMAAKMGTLSTSAGKAM